ncbi:hypothetical protein NECAME_01354 [Necator americanus]|uniref:Uncharacterized protein n=1 Tax=Necator americanus TaxID=51031 RepID=W2TYU3_NECAM|nr:hypothetical protein NECAME_01354 [Necator americanus]ETN86226.1 hypothetical protein NECAME_01354 [Necator americanus]
MTLERSPPTWRTYSLARDREKNWFDCLVIMRPCKRKNFDPLIRHRLAPSSKIFTTSSDWGKY